MRKVLRWLLTLVVLTGTAVAGVPPAGAAADPEPGTTDIRDRIEAVPGMSLIEEKPVDGYRFFVLGYQQPVDHRHPGKGTFTQRISLLHKGEDRPTVFFTSGYDLNTEPRRSEPTQLLDGNQVSMEYRFFTPSRPDPADWSKLDIWQAASDQHRIRTALGRIYERPWISTGGSKGGMTATYYRRFYPRDLAGTVAYVAPNDVHNDEDSAYEEFFGNVGSRKCRERLDATQREIFERRVAMVDRLRAAAKKEKWTFRNVGGADRAFELVAQDLVWGFWQYHLEEEECAEVPGTDASTADLYAWADEIGGWDSGADQGMESYTPYYYQAGTQLGSPDYETPVLDDLRKYPGLNTPRTYVPKDIPMTFDGRAMKDVDRWVRTRSSQMLFVNGEKDPWSAEPFRVGRGSKDAHVYTAPGANHGAEISMLEPGDRKAATASLLKWAGVDDESDGKAQRLTTPDPRLDGSAVEERRMGPRALP